ncbi:hypothetical protein, partial [Fibrella forsythiae]
MLSITEKAVFTRLNQHVQAHNEVQANLLHKIRHGSLLTLNALVSIYCQQLRVYLRSPLAIDSAELPPLYTNRRLLATLTKAGTRTIYDHLEKLIAAGLVRKQFRGHRHDFTLWISPWIMLGEAFEPIPLIDLSRASHPGFSPHMRQTSPDKNTFKGNTNYPKGGVETVDKYLGDVLSPVPPSPRGVRCDVEILTLKREADPKAHHPGRATLKGAGGGGAAGPLSTLIAQITSQGGPVGASSDTGGDLASGARHVGTAEPTGGLSQPTTSAPGSAATAASASAPADLEATKRYLTKAFWEVAREKLWPAQRFSPQHTKDILNLIWRDVLYGRMKCPSPEACHDLYAQRITQLELVEKFGHRQQWASFMPPKCFFSYAHYQGQLQSGARGNFHHTTPWLLANQKAALLQDHTRLIDRAITSVNTLKAPRKWQGELTTLA